MKSNKIKHTDNLQECVDYIMNNRAGWTQFTSWYMEKQGTNRQRANRVWSEAWEIITEDFEDNIKKTVNQTLLKLEELEEVARTENDRRVWLEVIKYQNKIKGGEIERSQVEVKGELNVNLSWGTETPWGTDLDKDE
jgi:hypothetical protein